MAPFPQYWRRKLEMSGNWSTTGQKVFDLSEDYPGNKVILAVSTCPLQITFLPLTVAEIFEPNMSSSRETGTSFPPIPAGKRLETFGTQSLLMVVYTTAHYRFPNANKIQAIKR
jgi:hypothetical protein